MVTTIVGERQKRRAGLFLHLSLAFWLLACANLLRAGQVENFEYIITTNNTIWITNYTGAGGDVAIPDTIQELPVTRVHDHAFQGCHKILSVTFGKNVTAIGNNAFAQCAGLSQIIIPDKVFRIEPNAFSSCGNVTNLVLGNGLFEVGNSAFEYCTRLEKVDFGHSVVFIGSNAFLACSQLKSLNLPDSLVDMQTAAFAFCTGLTHVTLGNGLTSIGSHAFENCSGLGEVIAPNSVELIRECAFMGCASLTNVTLSAYLTRIDVMAFANCAQLNSLTFPATLQILGFNVVLGCPNLTSLYFKGNAPETTMGVLINAGAHMTAYHLSGTTGWSEEYYGWPTALWAGQVPFGYQQTSPSTIEIIRYQGTQKDLAIPSNIDGLTVTKIGDYAFSKCTSITNLVLPNTVKSLGCGAFSECPSLQTICLGTNLACIGDTAFHNCQALHDLCIPDSVGCIERGAFEGCHGLTNLILGQNVTNIGYAAFGVCTGLTSITLPESVAVVDDYAFGCCSSLTNFNFSSNLTYLGRSAFYWCSSLTNISLPNKLTTLAPYTFQLCYNLKNIGLPKHLEDVGAGAFDNCGSLTQLKFPPSLNTIGDWAFSGCGSLTNLSFYGNAPELLGKNTFFWTTNGYVYYLPNTSGWKSDFGGWPTRILEVASLFEYEPITANTVAITNYLGSESSLDVPGVIEDMVVTTLRASTFLQNSNLTQITIPASIAAIETGIFSNCSALTNICVNADNQAFASVDGVLFDHSLSTLIQYPPAKAGGYYEVPGTVTNVGAFAFSDSLRLTNVAVPASVNTLQSSAFSQCAQLLSVNFAGNAPVLADDTVFANSPYATIYYYDGTMGWSDTFGGRPTSMQLNPALFRYCALNGTQIEITQYLGSNAVVTLPEALDGLTVASLGTNAFAGMQTLHQVNLPSQCAKVAAGAFADCSNLVSVVFATNVASLGDGAFRNCARLGSVSFPDSLTNLGANVFGGCAALTNLQVNWSNPAFNSWDGVLVSTPPRTLLLCPPGRAASFSVNSNVVAIADYAFAGCSQIARLYFATAPIPLLGEHVFEGATNLTVYHPASVTGWDATYGGRPVAVWSSSLFYSYETTPSGTATITHYTGDGGYVDIPSQLDGLTVGGLAAGAFAGRTDIGSVSIPAGVTNIAPGAFYGCSGLTNFGVDYFNPAYATGNGVLVDKAKHVLVQYPPGRVGEYVVPENISGLADQCFAGCAGLTRVCFLGAPPTLQGDAVFAGSSQASAGYLVGQPGWAATYGGVPALFWEEPLAFDYEIQYGLIVTITKYKGYRVKVTVPETIAGLPVTDIGPWAFAWQQDITNVVLPDSLSDIGAFAFYSCTGMQSIRFPDRLSGIDQQAFNGCSSLESAILPDSLFVMCYGAFINCGQLKTVTVGTNTTSLAGLSFYGCSNLLSITVDPANPYLSSVDGVLFNQTQTKLLIFPPGRDSSYSVPEGVTNVADYAFASCDKLSNLILPSSMTQLSPDAIYYSQGLTNITVAEENPAYCHKAGVLLNKTKRTLLQYPAGLAGTYTVPDEVETIAPHAFAGSPALTNIVLGQGVITIGKNAFSSCGALQSVAMQHNLTTIEDEAFSECPLLEKLNFDGNSPRFIGYNLFATTNGASQAKVYYYDDTTGWADTFAGQPTVKLHRLTAFEQWAATNNLAAQFPNACGEQDDPDHDGLSNWQEMAAGTDPVSAKSALAFDPVAKPEALSAEDQTPLDAGQFALYFQSVPGKTYVVESCPGLAGDWTTAATVTASTAQKRVALPRPAGHAFYRVRLQP